MTAAELPLIIPYPAINPVLVKLGPLAIRWYALAYIAGLVLGWRYLLRLSRNTALWRDAPGKAAPANATDIDDILVFATLGVVLGGRIGYILFYGLIYQTAYYLDNPLRMFYVWEGGMSFHGGLLGVTIALLLFCRHRKLDPFRIGDFIALAAPIGLFFGRIANFINGELFGHVTNAPWAMVFCNGYIRAMNNGTCPGGLVARHPSQLYEATLEGLVLFVVLRFVSHHTRALARPGLTMGIFLVGYGAARIFCEFFRVPEIHIGHTFITMGMLLSSAMWVAAAWLIRRALKMNLPAPTGTGQKAAPPA